MVILKYFLIAYINEIVCFYYFFSLSFLVRRDILHVYVRLSRFLYWCFRILYFHDHSLTHLYIRSSTTTKRARYHVSASGSKNGSKWFTRLNTQLGSECKEYSRDVRRAKQNGTHKRINVKKRCDGCALSEEKGVVTSSLRTRERELPEKISWSAETPTASRYPSFP